MHGVRGLRRRCVDQAEDLALGLTHPIAEESDVVRILRFEVFGVGLGHAIDSGSAVDSVDIHVEGHERLPRVVAGQLERKDGEYAAASGSSPQITGAACPSFMTGFARRSAGPAPKIGRTA